MTSEQGQSKSPSEVLNAPGADSPNIPLHPEIAFAFDEEPRSSQEISERQRILNALWNTPLGQTFYNFVFAKIEADQVSTRSFQFIKRLFANAEFLSIRQAALQALTQDLYARNLMTSDATRRILLLQGDMIREAKQSSSKVKDWFVNQGAAFLIASIPFGSPAVREEAGKVVARSRRAMDRYFGREEANHEVKSLRLKRLGTREVFYRYQPSQFLSFFFSTFGGYSMLYFFYYDQLSETIGKHAKDKVMLFELDDLVRALQI